VEMLVAGANVFVWLEDTDLSDAIIWEIKRNAQWSRFINRWAIGMNSNMVECGE
jgi:hypothetical protein